PTPKLPSPLPQGLPPLSPIMARFTAAFALVAAAALGMANAVEYKVRVRNLTYLQPFSPPLVVAHTDDVALFKEGLPASDEIKAMAENGDNSGLVALLSDPSVAPYICGYVVSDGALEPLGTWRGTMEVDTGKCSGRIVYSTVGMLVNTNDAFYGIDAVRLPRVGSSKEFPPAFDA
ncbi:unnamed protein product, partial [Sphacelaria rigidula]